MNLVSTRWHRHARAAALSLVLAAGAGGGAWAQGIVLQALDDNSGTEPDVDIPPLDIRFASRVESRPPTLVGDRAELTLRHTWSFVARASGPAYGGSFERELGWALTLQVQDPDRRGFELSVDHRLSGIIGAGRDPLGWASTQMPGYELWFFESFATQPRRLEALTTPAASIDQGGGVERRHVAHAGRASAGRFEGTQSFLFFLQPIGAAIAEVSPVPGYDSFAWLQFGRGTTEPALAFINPGPGAPPLDDLGHVVTFRVDYAVAPVPEPTTAALLAAGLLFTLRHGRRRLA